ncbi:MAG: coproporphyrinogen III oxidase [Ignavibacteria bacterium]
MASLYLHIPFCEKKCVYCDFYSIETLSPMKDFLDALHREIALRTAFGMGTTFTTIFLGGGTPSLLHPHQLEKILSKLASCFSISSDAEVTLETNPGTVTEEKLRAYRSLGVNRLSIGVQSFHEDELRFLTRIHNAEQARQCVQLARRTGFDNVSLDLIYALPGQTLTRWEATLRQAIALEPNHISAYSLIVEDGTPLARMVHAGIIAPLPDDVEATFYEFTMAFMQEHGFEHYEVSNYAKPGFRSRHNSTYWRHDNYLGFGPSAHSFWKHTDTHARRWSNIAHLSHYCATLRRGTLPIAYQEALGQNEILAEEIFLGLRTDGVPLRTLQRHPSPPNNFIARLVADGTALIEHDVLRLTPKGYLLCDEIATHLMP